MKQLLPHLSNRYIIIALLMLLLVGLGGGTVQELWAVRHQISGVTIDKGSGDPITGIHTVLFLREETAENFRALFDSSDEEGKNELFNSSLTSTSNELGRFKTLALIRTESKHFTLFGWQWWGAPQIPPPVFSRLILYKPGYEIAQFDVDSKNWSYDRDMNGYRTIIPPIEMEPIQINQ